jgi:hypothetical protein
VRGARIGCGRYRTWTGGSRPSAIARSRSSRSSVSSSARKAEQHERFVCRHAERLLHGSAIDLRCLAQDVVMRRADDAHSLARDPLHLDRVLAGLLTPHADPRRMVEQQPLARQVVPSRHQHRRRDAQMFGEEQHLFGVVVEQRRREHEEVGTLAQRERQQIRVQTEATLRPRSIERIDLGELRASIVGHWIVDPICLLALVERRAQRAIRDARDVEQLVPAKEPPPVQRRAGRPERLFREQLVEPGRHQLRTCDDQQQIVPCGQLVECAGGEKPECAFAVVGKDDPFHRATSGSPARDSRPLRVPW